MESCLFHWGLFPANPPLCCRLVPFPSEQLVPIAFPCAISEAPGPPIFSGTRT